MKAKVETAKQMIQKTRKEIKEEERERELRQKFEDLFGFEPDRVWWSDDLTLKAESVINFDDVEEVSPTLAGKQVIEVSFWVTEQKFDVGYDLDWNLKNNSWKEKGEIIYRYKWTRNLRKHKAVVEIMAR